MHSLRSSVLSKIITRNFHTSRLLSMPIKEGDAIPSVKLMDGEPGKLVDLSQHLKTKKAIVFAVPGAFTPGCSKTHLPGYVADADKLKSKGIQEIVCVSVNDPFVMSAWGDAHKATGKITMLSDPKAEFTKAVDMSLDLTDVLGNVRSKRYALVVENGIVKKVFEEPDGTGLTCSLSKSVADQI